MKKFILLGTGLSVALSVASVMAESDGSTFHALSNIAREGHVFLTPLRDANLAITEGGVFCIECNIVIEQQSNVCPQGSQCEAQTNIKHIQQERTVVRIVN
jgi:hypothetical protein